jgi:hypothetical protein
MGCQKKLDDPATLFAKIETRQYEAIRAIAFEERRSIAEIVREALDVYLESRSKEVK